MSEWAFVDLNLYRVDYCDRTDEDRNYGYVMAWNVSEASEILSSFMGVVKIISVVEMAGCVLGPDNLEKLIRYQSDEDKVVESDEQPDITISDSNPYYDHIST